MAQFYSESNWKALGTLTERGHQSLIRCGFTFHASCVASDDATFSSWTEDVSLLALELDDVVVHADEESPALVWIGMNRDAEEVVFTGVFGNGWGNEFAGISISATALDSALVKNVTIVAGEVNTLTDHADEEMLTAISATRDSEELIGAVDLLSGGRGERKGDQGDGDYCKRRIFTAMSSTSKSLTELTIFHSVSSWLERLNFKWWKIFSSRALSAIATEL
jgi:hypothetical protein